MVLTPIAPIPVTLPLYYKKYISRCHYITPFQNKQISSYSKLFTALAYRSRRTVVNKRGVAPRASYPTLQLNIGVKRGGVSIMSNA
jgi:hypothetical protein